MDIIRLVPTSTVPEPPCGGKEITYRWVYNHVNGKAAFMFTVAGWSGREPTETELIAAVQAALLTLCPETRGKFRLET